MSVFGNASLLQLFVEMSVFIFLQEWSLFTEPNDFFDILSQLETRSEMHK